MQLFWGETLGLRLFVLEKPPPCICYFRQFSVYNIIITDKNALMATMVASDDETVKVPVFCHRLGKVLPTLSKKSVFLLPANRSVTSPPDSGWKPGRDHRYRGEIPKLAAIFSRHGEQFGGIRFYSESACVNCIFLRYERVFNRARKAATSATHIKVIARVICIAHSPHLFSAKSRIPPNCSPCREKNLRGRY